MSTRLLLVFAVLYLTIGPLQAQYDDYLYVGGVCCGDSTLTAGDSIQMRRALEGQRLIMQPHKAAGVGADLTFTNKQQIFTLPLSYLVLPMLELSASIPVVRFENINDEEVGLGDLSVGGSYLQGDLSADGAMKYVAHGELKLPTGDKDKTLGSDAYDLIVDCQAVRRFGGNLYAHASAGYRAITEDLDDAATLDVGGTYLLSGLPTLFPGGDYAIGYQLHATTVHFDTYLLDVLHTVQYVLDETTALRLALLLPFFTTQDQDRRATFNLGITSFF